MNHPAPTIPYLEEAQRRFLLQVMGIQLYLPRDAVPPVETAVPARQANPVEYPDLPEPSSSVAEDVAATATAAPSGAAAALNLLQSGSAGQEPGPGSGGLAGQVNAGHIEAPAPAPSAAPTATAQVNPHAPVPLSASRSLSFQLLLLQTDRKLAVCAGIPSRPRAVLERAEQQLLRNILHWLGCAVVADAAARQFSWPLPGGIGANDAAVAGPALQGFLAQAQQELGFSRLLVLGGDLLGTLETGLVDTTAGWQGWYGPSLAGMLEQPALKRELWLRLQSLHAGLQG